MAEGASSQITIKGVLVGVITTVLSGLILYWLTHEPSNRPRISAKATVEKIFFPISGADIPTDSPQTISDALAELTKASDTKYGVLAKTLNPHIFDTLRVLATAECVLRFELQNQSEAKATNINILMPYVAAYALDKPSRLLTVNENKVAVGDLLPSEIRTLTVLRWSFCPTSASDKLKSDIYVSFDGGTVQPDFFADLPPFAKLSLLYQWLPAFVIAFLIWLVFTFGVLMVNYRQRLLARTEAKDDAS